MEDSSIEKISQSYKNEYKILSVFSLCLLVVFLALFLIPWVDNGGVLPISDSSGNSAGTISVDDWASPFSLLIKSDELIGLAIVCLISFALLSIFPMYSFIQRNKIVSKKSPLLLFGKIIVLLDIVLFIVSIIVTFAVARSMY